MLTQHSRCELDPRDSYLREGFSPEFEISAFKRCNHRTSNSNDNAAIVVLVVLSMQRYTSSGLRAMNNECKSCLHSWQRSIVLKYLAVRMLCCSTARKLDGPTSFPKFARESLMLIPSM